MSSDVGPSTSLATAIRPHTPDVLMLPDFTLTNPYQWELTLALAEQGLRVTLTDGIGDRPLRGAIRAYGHPKAVHLHWIDPFIPDDDARGTRTDAFLSDLADLRRRGTRIIWTVHNLFRHGVRHLERMRSVRRRLVELADVAITHCGAAKAHIARAYELDQELTRRIDVIPHGNYLNAYPATVSVGQARADLGLERHDFVFLFLGQLRAYKGLTSLLEEFASLAGGDLRLVVAGRAYEEQLKQELRRRCAEDPRLVVHLGHVPDDRVQVYMRAADVVVLPYLDVFTSGGAILAISFGRPVVAPAIGCLPETLSQDSNVLYEPAQPHALGEAMRAALDLDVLAAGARNRRQADNLDWSAIAAATRRAYGLPRRSPTPLARRRSRPSPWQVRAELAAEDLARTVPEADALAVLDEEALRHDFGRATVPFPSRNGRYDGPPAKPWDVNGQIEELRRSGVRYLAVMWPAFWWFDEYPSLARTLHAEADCVLRTDQLLLFRLSTAGLDADGRHVRG